MACADMTHYILLVCTLESYRTVAIGNVFKPCWSKAPATTATPTATTATSPSLAPVTTATQRSTQHSPRYFPAATAGTWNSYLNETETSSVTVTSANNESIDVQPCDDNMLQCSNIPKHAESFSIESELEAVPIQLAQEKVMHMHRLRLYSLYTLQSWQLV
jgi:hypothetical protein